MRRTIAILSLILAAGCASDPKLDAGALLSAQRPPDGSLSADSIQPDATATLLLETLSGDEQGALWRIAILPQPDGALRITRTADGADQPASEELRVPIDGGWALAESINRDDDAVTTFDPPLLVAPPSLDAGEPVSATSAMVVRSIADPDVIKEQGEATQTLTFDALQTVRTARGEHTAARVRAEFNASLGAARVERVTERWHGLDGDPWILAERMRETVKALGGLYDRRRGHLLALRSAE